MPLQLKSYIPIGGCLKWIPATGDEPPMRFVPGFDLQWYHRRLGIDFSEHWHTDAVARYDALLEMKRYVNGLFPEIEGFRFCYNREVEESCATISGVHGVMLIPRIYGLPTLYRTESWPAARPNSLFTLEELQHLPDDILENNPVVQNLFAQMDVIEKRYGKIDGYPDYQGTLNTAFTLCGSEIFLLMIDEPELTARLFDHIERTTRTLAGRIQARQRKSGFEVDQIGTSNCVMNMISPEMYREHLLKYDWRSSQAFGRYAMHTCNWNITPYLEVLRELQSIGYLDMGGDSDFIEVQQTFPDTRKNVLINPVMMNGPREDLTRLIDRVAYELGPCDISMGSIDPSVPDEAVRWMASYIHRHPANQSSR